MTSQQLIKMTGWDILRENAIQIIMYILGTAIMAMLWWPLGIIYLVYGIASNFLCMAWVCPYCGHYYPGTCKAGFHILSGRRFKAQPGRTFGSEFRRRSWVLYPGWFLPPLVALYLLITAFSWITLALLVVFCVVAFWWLPESSKKHCEGCETEDCPRRPKPIKVQ
jgi:cobalamin synthase